MIMSNRWWYCLGLYQTHCLWFFLDTNFPILSPRKKLFPFCTSKLIFVYENRCVIWVKHVPDGPINQMTTLVLIMAWRRIGVKAMMYEIIDEYTAPPKCSDDFAPTVTATIVTMFGEAVSVSPHTSISEVSVVLRGMSRVEIFDKWQWISNCW